jgi:MoaA/NifB/PqqE/SkfB family radical SAM enzyme
MNPFNKLVQIRKDARFSATVLRGQPFQVLLQLTNRCNMRCSFCDFWPNVAPPKEELSTAEYTRIAGELAELGCFVVSIEGGEPMVRPDLTEIVKQLSKHHITTLFTNGWFVTPDKARELFDAGLDHVSVSIDFATAERHDAKRGLDGAFDRAWKAVDIFAKAAPRGAAKQVSVMTVLMNENHRDMDALFTATARRGVGHQVTLIATDGYRRGKSLVDRFPPPEVSDDMVALWSKHKHIGLFRDYFAKMKDFLGSGKMPTCQAGKLSFNIDHVGNVSTCIERIDEPVGNVRDAKLSTLHQRLVANHVEIETCQRCWTACRGFSQSLADGGSAQAWIEMGLRMRTD